VSNTALDTLTLTRDARNAFDVVENWHNEHHTGRLWDCDQQPCNAVAAVGR
jgi:hypothetical protein